MSEPKDTTSFFRKVVKFVANPSTDWAQIAVPAEETRENEFARGELKAMIERKRRNDFVRKREFDMLRRVRREGLTSEQLAALGGSSRLDDPESRGGGEPSSAKAESGVKAKIDAIEQQMVGDAARRSAPGKLAPVPAPRRPPEFYDAPTEPVPMQVPMPMQESMQEPTRKPAAGVPAAAHVAPEVGGRVDDFFAEKGPAHAGSRVVMSAGLAPLADIRFDDATPLLGEPFAQEPADVAHDPELDEAVIAFANADFEPCEHALITLTGPGGLRARHADTWLVLFDLYRAIGEHAKFEALALEYAGQFGRSAPQWFSMPRLVAERAVDRAVDDRPSHARLNAQVGWTSPERIDADAIAQLASAALQMPLPWIFDWSRLRSIDAEGCARLSELFRKWSSDDLEMRWGAGEHLLGVLAEAAPAGVRDVDPAYWQLRLDALRMANRADQFDEAAIDYCVTYEVSPPSWEKVRCHVRVSSAGPSTMSPPMSLVSDVTTHFVESNLSDEPSAVQVGAVELSGQLVGDIGPTLMRLDGELGAASIVDVSCARLIRVDFIAAGDLLNWVLARRSENRTVRFIDTHRMVALFFGAMGINEHAIVKVQPV